VSASWYRTSLLFSLHSLNASCREINSGPMYVHTELLSTTYLFVLCTMCFGRAKCAALQKIQLLYSKCRVFTATPHCKEIGFYVFPEKELRVLTTNCYILVSLSDLNIPTFVHLFSCSIIGRTIRICKSLTETCM
jgi:hypothetical protein